MRIIFLNGGSLSCLPGQGPFEAGQEISVPEPDALQLIEAGLALPVAPPSSKPVTITIKTKGDDHV